MGLGDYLWPFQRPFSQIPCAREASISALVGGPCIGAAILAIKNRPLLSYKWTVYSGIAILWITFSVCRFDHAKRVAQTEQVKEIYASGKVD